jgi:hypothetical protein
MAMTLKESVSSESLFMKKVTVITLGVVFLAVLFTTIRTNLFMLRMGIVFQVLGVISTICLLFSFFIYSFWRSRLTTENETVETQNYQCWVNLNDAPSSIGAVLSFFLPIVGLILWATWNNSSPLKAKSCGKGALASLAVLVAAGLVNLQFSALLSSL